MENGEDGEKMASTFLKVGSDRSEVPLTSSLRNRRAFSPSVAISVLVSPS